MDRPTLLFLCTGNYYRSRFAEHFFNARAQALGVEERAISRGLALERGVENVGPISRHCLRGLADRSIEVVEPRAPLAVEPADFERVSRVIALDEQEHHPLMQERFPDWAERITYWDVTDVEPGPQYDPLAHLTALVEEWFELRVSV